jgi:hypothetical protein
MTRAYVDTTNTTTFTSTSRLENARTGNLETTVDALYRQNKHDLQCHEFRINRARASSQALRPHQQRLPSGMPVFSIS